MKIPSLLDLLEPKLLLTAALVVGGAYWFTKREVTKAVTAGAQAVNPVSEDNIFNRAFNALYKGVSGSDQTFGEDLYDWTHAQPAEPAVSPSGLPAYEGAALYDMLRRKEAEAVTAPVVGSVWENFVDTMWTMHGE